MDQIVRKKGAENCQYDIVRVCACVCVGVCVRVRVGGWAGGRGCVRVPSCLQELVCAQLPARQLVCAQLRVCVPSRLQELLKKSL